MPDEVAIGKSIVEAAKQAGVRRFVFSSVIDPILSALVNHAAKAPVEEAILDSDMEYTFLHPTLFFQGMARAWSWETRSSSVRFWVVSQEHYEPTSRNSPPRRRPLNEVNQITSEKNGGYGVTISMLLMAHSLA